MVCQQIRFCDPDGEELGGILVDNTYVICGCCGGVFEKDEVSILHIYTDWVDINEEITGDE